MSPFASRSHSAEALNSRDVVGQAKGILIVTMGLDEDAALAKLRERSQHSNRNLVDAAAAVVAQAKRGSQQYDD